MKYIERQSRDKVNTWKRGRSVLKNKYTSDGPDVDANALTPLLTYADADADIEFDIRSEANISQYNY